MKLKTLFKALISGTTAPIKEKAVFNDEGYIKREQYQVNMLRKLGD